jgi:prepilin-type processing-associated H-X9-DG protein/prepilin-type N-terminal cleavage/methylation domain-containing protein
MKFKHLFDARATQQQALRFAGFTVLELLVVLSIIGLCVALLLPAVMGARESARHTSCANHMRQIGIAIHNHHNRERRIPPAWRPTRDDSEFAYGWATDLLPELEQSSLRSQLPLSARPQRLASLNLAEQYSLPMLLCPSDIADKSFGLAAEHENDDEGDERRGENVFAPAIENILLYLPTTNYVGVYGTVEADDFDEYVGPSGSSFGDGSVIDCDRIAFADLQRGLSQTILVGERKMATVPSTWLGIDMRGEDAPCRLAGSAITAPNCDTCDECEFSSRHPGGSNFLWADGRVTIVSDSIDSYSYRESARRLRGKDGE